MSAVEAGPSGHALSENLSTSIADFTIGDKFYFAGNGALLCSEGPSHICGGALSPLMAHTWKIVDKVGVGQDPTKNTFNRVSCIDVGLEDGGWGEILMEIRVEKSE